MRRIIAPLENNLVRRGHGLCAKTRPDRAAFVSTDDTSLARRFHSLGRGVRLLERLDRTRRREAELGSTPEIRDKQLAHEGHFFWQSIIQAKEQCVVTGNLLEPEVAIDVHDLLKLLACEVEA